MSRTPTSDHHDEYQPRRNADRAWTPRRGLIRGTAACLIAGAILGGAWCALAWRRPDVVVACQHENIQVTLFMGVLGALVAFVMGWILFAVTHRWAQMVGGSSLVMVLAVMALMVIAKQMTVAATPGVDLPAGRIAGAAWMAPKMILVSNVGVWVGMALAVYACKDGESPLDILH